MDFSSIAEYIETLTTTPSPTGWTAGVEEFLIKNAESKGISYRKTLKGAVIYSFNGESSEGARMFASHVDTLGAMVKEVKEDRVVITPVGGFPALYIIGDYCTIHTRDGKQYEGTFLPNNPAVHVNSKLRELKPDFDNCSLRVDLAGDLSEAISIGDFVSFDPCFKVTNGYVKARHLDDKASAAILLHLADLIIGGAVKPAKDIHIFFNVTEETGQGLAASENVEELVIVDMGVVGEGCNGDEQAVSICAKDSSGPYNYQLTNQLIDICKEKELDHKIDIFPFYGSDGSAVLRACNDIKVALVGPGVGASHGYERTHEKALLSTGKLLVEYIKRG